MIHLAVREQPDCLVCVRRSVPPAAIKTGAEGSGLPFFRSSRIPGCSLWRAIMILPGREALSAVFLEPQCSFFAGEVISGEPELSQETARRSGIRHLTVCGHSYQKREYREALYDRCPLEKEGVHVLMAHGRGCIPYSMDYGKIASGGFDYVGHGTYSPPAIWRGGKLDACWCRWCVCLHKYDW